MVNMVKAKRREAFGFNGITMLASNLDQGRSSEPNSGGRKSFLKGISQNSRDRATKKLTKATQRSTRKIETAMMHSERVYKKSRWCFWARFIGKSSKYFPRLYSYTFGVVVPLWLLILISAGFGFVLANYEAPQEQES